MNFLKLKQFLSDQGEASYRYSQIVSDIVSGQAQAFEDIFTVGKSLREKLEQNLDLISVEEVQVLVAKDKRAYKALLKLKDGNFTETVLLNPKPSLWSVCISCQVGCPMGCKFCATGQLGLKRNLTAEEIADQILFWRQYNVRNKLSIRISNIVFMGMGEPFVNKEAVFESIKILTDPLLYGFGDRHLSVSTCGIVPVIEEFGAKFPQINLAISLHAPNQELREKLMPIAKKYSLDELMEALGKYLTVTKRKVFFEYVLISAENDSDKQAVELVNLLSEKFENRLHLAHVNLIVYNETDSGLKASEKERAQKFKRILESGHISVTIRKGLGQEIQGACGQLAGK